MVAILVESLNSPAPQLHFSDLKFITNPIFIQDVVLCACETWSHTLRKYSKVQVFGNKVFSKMFGSNKERDA